jgi:hypothetical protein
LTHWAHGANMAVTLLADYIGNMMLSYQHLNVEHPKEFWIQIDNCAREGKNSVVFAFLHHIVHYEWFSTVYVLALLQGHTHHKMDQKNVPWSIGEQRNAILSLHDLDQFLKRSYKAETKPEYTIVRKCFDWQTLFTNHMEKMFGYSEARLFKICRNKRGVVVMKWKTNAAELKWKGFSADGIKQHGIVLCSSFANSNPAEIPASHLEKDVVHGIVTHTGMQTNLSTTAKSFYNALEKDDTAYLTDFPLFENEGMWSAGRRRCFPVFLILFSQTAIPSSECMGCSI